jgi:ankyrin repeat protein
MSSSAPEASNKPLVEFFAAKGIDLNAKNRNRQTALDLAKQSNNQEMIGLLKKLGAKE